MSWDFLKKFLNELNREMWDFLKSIIKYRIGESILSNVEFKFRKPSDKEMILYTSDYCPHCKEIEEYIELMKEYARLHGYKLTVIKLNDPDEIEKAIEDGIEDIPIVHINDSGKIEQKHPIEIIKEIYMYKGRE